MLYVVHTQVAEEARIMKSRTLTPTQSPCGELFSFVFTRFSYELDDDFARACERCQKRSRLTCCQGLNKIAVLNGSAIDAEQRGPQMGKKQLSAPSDIVMVADDRTGSVARRIPSGLINPRFMLDVVMDDGRARHEGR